MCIATFSINLSKNWGYLEPVLYRKCNQTSATQMTNEDYLDSNFKDSKRKSTIVQVGHKNLWNWKHNLIGNIFNCLSPFCIGSQKVNWKGEGVLVFLGEIHLTRDSLLNFLTPIQTNKDTASNKITLTMISSQLTSSKSKPTKSNDFLIFLLRIIMFKVFNSALIITIKICLKSVFAQIWFQKLSLRSKNFNLFYSSNKF